MELRDFPVLPGTFTPGHRPAAEWLRGLRHGGDRSLRAEPFGHALAGAPWEQMGFGGRPWEYPSSLDGLQWKMPGNTHRAKWMMTGGTPHFRKRPHGNTRELNWLN